MLYIIISVYQCTNEVLPTRPSTPTLIISTKYNIYYYNTEMTIVIVYYYNIMII